MRTLVFALAVIGAATQARAAAPAAPQAPPVVRIESGDVRGVLANSARVFHSLPYAAPPIGDLRWRAPARPLRWQGVRDAAHEGPACEQPVYPDGRPNEGLYSGPVSEDCLTLTVTAPLRGRRAPVLVWIPGGGNIAGAANVPSYDGAGFARDGVILVTVNYRLGAFGFLADPALAAGAAPGTPLRNYGLQDQIAALRWVKRNIAAFGGDPAKVTLGGESAGGVDVLALMTAPAARGLFARAVVESGGGWFPPRTLAQAKTQTADLLSRLGFGPDASGVQLRAAPAEKILAEQGPGWGPTIDGRLLTHATQTAFARGEEAPVPLLIGANSFEASLMAAFGGKPAGVLATASPELKAAYAPDRLDEEHLAWAIFGDRLMVAPARWIAGRHSARAPTYLYHFSDVIAAHRARQPGAHHAGEIPFVFDSQEAVPGRAAELTDDDRQVTRFVHSCWVSFIATGAPACMAGGRVWPAYSLTSDELMHFTEPPVVVANFEKRELDAQERAADLPQ